MNAGRISMEKKKSQSENELGVLTAKARPQLIKKSEKKASSLREFQQKDPEQVSSCRDSI